MIDSTETMQITIRGQAHIFKKKKYYCWNIKARQKCSLDYIRLPVSKLAARKLPVVLQDNTVSGGRRALGVWIADGRYRVEEFNHYNKLLTYLLDYI
jgi:hypothetical protein